MTTSQLYLKFGLWIGGSICLMIVLWWLVIHPATTGLSNDVGLIIAAEQNFDKTDVTAKQFITAERNLTQLTSVTEQIRSAYVSSATPFKFIGGIEDLANQFDVTLSLDVADYVPNQTPGAASTVPVSITAIGPLNQVASFLQATLREPVELTPQSLQIEANTADVSGGTVKANLQVLSYWL